MNDQEREARGTAAMARERSMTLLPQPREGERGEWRGTAEVFAPRELDPLATAAHEIRSAVAAMTTSSELLLVDAETVGNARVRRLLTLMHRRAFWLQSLVENMLCAAATREGKLPLRMEPTDLGEVVAYVQNVSEPLLSQRHQRLRVRLATPLPVVVADGLRLGQALVNLILNASKFAAEGTTVDLRVTAKRDAVRVCVSDRGPGIMEEQKSRLFDAFFRGSSSTTARADGLGLGLAIVKAIVMGHGGQVGVENRAGGGALFWFEIPTRDRFVLTRRVNEPTARGGA